MKVNFMQDRQTRIQTDLRVDHFNKKVLKGKKHNDEIKKDQFLKLLVTELKNQNPLDPMKDRDFIAQMAQLTSLEKMEKVREGMDQLISNSTNSSLYNMLGKKVTFVNEAGRQEVGSVEAVEIKGNEGFLKINKSSVNPKAILKVE